MSNWQIWAALLALALIAALLLIFVPGAHAQNDIPPQSWFCTTEDSFPQRVCFRIDSVIITVPDQKRPQIQFSSSASLDIGPNDFMNLMSAARWNYLAK